MVKRAIHIKVVPTQSTESFLNALKCFVSRRGMPKTIYSYNGTKFRGADRYPNLNFQNDFIWKYSDENRADWQFNPPYTPHCGGIQESSVKNAKRSIPIVTKDQTFTENKLRIFYAD